MNIDYTKTINRVTVNGKEVPVLANDNYDLLKNKPKLKTDNAESQPTSAEEELQGIVNLHKVAKTGKFTDLLDITEANESQAGVVTMATDSEVNEGINTTKAVTPKQLNDKIEQIKALGVLNTNVVNVTLETVQEVMTQYVVDNYQRQPKTNDSIIGTFTDLNNDKIQYAYSEDISSWYDVGRNSVDLTGYVKKTDIVDNLDSVDANKVLSAKQGNELSKKITANKSAVDEALNAKENTITEANAGENITITRENGILKISGQAGGGSGGGVQVLQKVPLTQLYSTLRGQLKDKQILRLQVWGSSNGAVTKDGKLLTYTIQDSDGSMVPTLSSWTAAKPFAGLYDYAYNGGYQRRDEYCFETTVEESNITMQIVIYDNAKFRFNANMTQWYSWLEGTSRFEIGTVNYPYVKISDFPNVTFNIYYI